MSIELGPKIWKQEELVAGQRRQVEEKKKSAGATSVVMGFFVIVFIGMALAQAFPTFFHIVFSILGWTMKLAVVAVAIYFFYFIFKKFKAIAKK